MKPRHGFSLLTYGGGLIEQLRKHCIVYESMPLLRMNPFLVYLRTRFVPVLVFRETHFVSRFCVVCVTEINTYYYHLAFR